MFEIDDKHSDLRFSTKIFLYLILTITVICFWSMYGIAVASFERGEFWGWFGSALMAIDVIVLSLIIFITDTKLTELKEENRKLKDLLDVSNEIIDETIDRK